MAATSKAKSSRLYECELFNGGQPEAAESGAKWKNCLKNPDHTKFISAKEFMQNHMPKVNDVFNQIWLLSCLNLTVRLRVSYTSKERPDDDEFSFIRGTGIRRMGTGFIHEVSPSKANESCPCGLCSGKEDKKHWTFHVRTAHHVVYNTEEAKKTQIDLNFDDEDCEKDGRMKSVWGVRVNNQTLKRDWCSIECVTCDEQLAQTIESFLCCFDFDRIMARDISGLDLLQALPAGCVSAVMISHPHGQPKKITVGEARKEENACVSYTVPSCPGCSGAPVFRGEYSNLAKFIGSPYLFFPIHGGTLSQSSLEDGEEQVNYGFEFLLY